VRTISRTSFSRLRAGGDSDAGQHLVRAAGEAAQHAGRLGRVLEVTADEVARRPIGIHRTDDAGSASGQGREDEESRRFHLEVHDALARHFLREVRVADGQLGDRAPLRTEEPRCRRRQPDMGPVSEPLAGLDERQDRLVIGDRGIPIVDVPARRRLETDRSSGDGQVTQTHPWLEGSARADPDEGRTVRDRQDLSHDDLDVVRADAGRHDRHPLTLVHAGRRCELPVSVLELDGIEARGDP